jgi:hypothetical protein
MINLTTKRNGFKSFFYFRIGYATYLAFFIGIINLLTTSYFLALKRIPEIIKIFPTFEIYVITIIAIGIPLVTFVGWLHFKRVGTFSAEAAISQQALPYNFMYQPGYNIEVFGPAYLEILKINKNKLTGQKLSDKELEKILNLEKKLKHLIDGGHVGNPPRGTL